MTRVDSWRIRGSGASRPKAAWLVWKGRIHQAVLGRSVAAPTTNARPIAIQRVRAGRTLRRRLRTQSSNAIVGDVDAEPKPTGDHETPTNAAARMLEVAAITSEQLVTDAESKAESLVGVAQAQADAIEQASRDKAGQVATELARSKEEQATALERERAATLAELSDTKSALEAQIADLREMESLHRKQLQLLLTEQLSRLDTPLPEPLLDPPTDAGRDT